MQPAGGFNSRIKILSAAGGKDAAGQPLNQWAIYDEVWSKAISLNGVQTIRAGAEASTVKVSFRIRYREDITEAMRVQDGGNIFSIRSILPGRGTKDYVDLVCELTK